MKPEWIQPELKVFNTKLETENADGLGTDGGLPSQNSANS